MTVNAGTLATATFNDNVASLVLTNGGSLTGTGTLTAGTYTLNGGTVGANLGLGTATSSAGTTTLNGTLAGDLNVSGGVFNLGGADRIGLSSAVNLSSGTLGMGANNNTVGSFTISGASEAWCSPSRYISQPRKACVWTLTEVWMPVRTMSLRVPEPVTFWVPIPSVKSLPLASARK